MVLPSLSTVPHIFGTARMRHSIHAGTIPLNMYFHISVCCRSYRPTCSHAVWLRNLYWCSLLLLLGIHWCFKPNSCNAALILFFLFFPPNKSCLNFLKSRSICTIEVILYDSWKAPPQKSNYVGSSRNEMHPKHSKKRKSSNPAFWPESKKSVSYSAVI